jgi:hypothetical protein
MTNNIITLIITIFSIVVTGIIALQFQSFKAWLLWGVSEAENFFGSGTGQLKLQYAYDLAIERFPIFAKLIPYSLFKWLVDKALDEMRRMIEENENIAKILQQNQTE